MNEQTTQHSFSLTVAKQYGDAAAIIFGYLSSKIHRSKHYHEGKQWYYETVADIAKKYPYMSKTKVYEAIQKLIADDGLLITGNYNKKGFDRTTWYAFKTKEAGQLADRRLAYFDIGDAGHHGVAKAVLISLIAYMINQERRNNPKCNSHPMSATELARILPYAKSTIQRKLKELVADDFILIPVTYIDYREPTSFRFSELWDDEKLVSSQNDKLTEIPNKSEVSVAQSRITNLGGSNPNVCVSNPNESGSIPNDYTILETLLRNPIKRRLLESSTTVLRPAVESATHSLTQMTSPDLDRILAEFAVYLSSPTSVPPTLTLAADLPSSNYRIPSL